MSWWEHGHYHWARQTTAWTRDTFPDLLCVYWLNRWTSFITLAVRCSETLISGKIQERDYVVKTCWKTYSIARDPSPLWWALGKITQSGHRRLSMVSIQSHSWKYQRSMNCKSLGNTWWYNPAPKASGLTSSGKTCFPIAYILSTRCLVVNNSLEDKRQSNPLRARASLRRPIGCCLFCQLPTVAVSLRGHCLCCFDFDGDPNCWYQQMEAELPQLRKRLLLSFQNRKLNLWLLGKRGTCRAWLSLAKNLRTSYSFLWK